MYNMIKKLNKNILIAKLMDDEEDSNYISINESYVSNNKYLTYRHWYRSFTEIERPYFGLGVLLKVNLSPSMSIIKFYNIRVI